MSFGGYHPYPRRFGGGKPLLEVVHESLNAQRGTAFDAHNPSTIVWLENHAIARAITFDGWGVNERLSYQCDPDRMTDMLPRWEGILKLSVPTGTTERARRVVVRAVFARFGEGATHATLVQKLASALGSAFVGIEYISRDNAVVHAPDNTYPWGTVAPGHPWYSTVAHILVRMQKPNGWSEGDFYAAAAKVTKMLDPIAPAWVTWSWYRPSQCGTSYAVPGGPSAAGFFLGCPGNLGNQVFGVDP